MDLSDVRIILVWKIRVPWENTKRGGTNCIAKCNFRHEHISITNNRHRIPFISTMSEEQWNNMNSHKIGWKNQKHTAHTFFNLCSFQQCHICHKLCHE